MKAANTADLPDNGCLQQKDGTEHQTIQSLVGRETKFSYDYMMGNLSLIPSIKISYH